MASFLRCATALVVASGLAAVSAEEDVPSPVPEAPEWWGPLREMVRQCGTTGLDDIYLGDFTRPDGARLRGLGVSRHVKKGERFYCEPHRCQLTNASDGAHERWQGERAVLECTERQRLALFMAEERLKGPSSRWAVLLSSFLTEDQLRQYHPAYLPDGLLPPQANAYWRHRGERMRRCHSAYAKKAGARAVSFDEAYFHEVLGEVYIDTYALERGGPKYLLSIPLANLCNAGREDLVNVDEPTVEIERGSGRFQDCWVAAQDLEPGTEIVCSYKYIGASEAELFRNMGFFLYSGDERDAHHRDLVDDYGDFGADFTTREAEEVAELEAFNICEGLGPEEFPEPNASAHPIVLNFWRFAKSHCHGQEGDDDYAYGGEYADSDDTEL